MIVLDTNVLYEPLKSKPAQKVVEWLDQQSELRFGVLGLPNGKRKNALAAQVERVLGLFEGRTLDCDSAAADKLAQIAAECEKNGKRAAAPDAYIAACAAASQRHQELELPQADLWGLISPNVVWGRWPSRRRTI